MPPPYASSLFDLILLPNTFYVYQLPLDEAIPQVLLEALSHPPTPTTTVSLTRTPEELSFTTDILLDKTVSPETLKRSEWRCVLIKGPMPFGNLGSRSSRSLRN